MDVEAAADVEVAEAEGEAEEAAEVEESRAEAAEEEAVSPVEDTPVVE